MLTKDEKIALAAKLMKISLSDAEKYCSMLDELGTALYFSIPVKGGGSLIVADDGSVLYANSSVSPQTHIDVFLKGRRTPIEAFEHV